MWSSITSSSGVLERLGFGFDVLQQINPGIVQAVMPGWGLSRPAKVLGRLGLAVCSLTPESCGFGVIPTRRWKPAARFATGRTASGQ